MWIRVIDIEWDIGDATPEQAGVPEFIDIELPDDADVNAAIERTLAGFTVPHKSFNWEVDPEVRDRQGGDAPEIKVSPEARAKAERILADNGVDPDEVQSVLQAIGYALLDAELYPAPIQPPGQA